MSASSGRRLRIAVLGASGTVGAQIVDLIRSRDLPCSELRLFASESSSVAASTEIDAESLPIATLRAPDELAECDIAFLAIPEGRASEIVAARPGPVLIDLSAATRAPLDAAPLVAPGLTPRERVHELEKFKLFAVAHPAAQVAATVLSAIGPLSGLVGATVIVAAAAEGRDGVSRLFNQSVELLNARLDLTEGETQIAFNVLLPERANDLAEAITAQTTALIDSAPALNVGVIQVPAFHGGAIALHVPVSGTLPDWSSRLRTAPGIVLIESDSATGFADATNHDAAIVRMHHNPGGAMLWCVFDSARIAALSAIWVAETLAAAVS
jgi:aspartate-semialdehyde dehydrogenase